jgi:hypothetical protein
MGLQNAFSKLREYKAGLAEGNREQEALVTSLRDKEKRP